MLSFLAFLVIILKSGSFHMRLWDESLFAVNTYEMMHNGKYFSTYFDGLPDLANTKPVLTLWIQMLFAKLFGYNEFSLRLPSVISAVITIIIVFIFIYKNFDYIWAWSSALILMTSMGFIHFHTARTADADSLLTLFLTVANINFVLFISHEKKKHILLFLLFLTLAFATKMFAALLFLPAYLIILIYTRNLFKFALNFHFLIGILIFLIVNAVFFTFRELDTPGYLKEILFKDAGRIYRVIETHRGDFVYYLDNFYNYRFATWFIFLIAGCILIFVIKEKKEKALLLMFAFFTLSYLLIISASITKLEWYDMPLYPYISVIAAYPIYFLIKHFITLKTRFYYQKAFTIVLLIFAYPYFMTFSKSQSAGGINEFEKMNEASERYLFKKSVENANLDKVIVYHKGFKSALLFYKYKFNEKGQKIIITDRLEFLTDNKVLVSADSLKTEVTENYYTETIDYLDNAVLFRILKSKK